MKKCLIKRYDPDITEPPFKFITLGEFECPKPIDDQLGQRFCILLHSHCWREGYSMKFYSMSDTDGYDYDVVVK